MTLHISYTFTSLLTCKSFFVTRGYLDVRCSTSEVDGHTSIETLVLGTTDCRVVGPLTSTYSTTRPADTRI